MPNLYKARPYFTEIRDSLKAVFDRKLTVVTACISYAAISLCMAIALSALGEKNNAVILVGSIFWPLLTVTCVFVLLLSSASSRKPVAGSDVFRKASSLRNF